MSGEPGERIGVVARLFVVRERRRAGAGEALVRAATDFAEAGGLRLVLGVLVKDAAAIRLYERLGWRFVGEAQHAYGEGERMAARCYVWPAG